GFGFRREAGAVLLARLAEDHLQGDGALEALLPRLVNDTHAAAAQLVEDLVAGHRRQGRVGRRLLVESGREAGGVWDVVWAGSGREEEGVGASVWPRAEGGMAKDTDSGVDADSPGDVEPVPHAYQANE